MQSQVILCPHVLEHDQFLIKDANIAESDTEMLATI